jgi:hypothetical protein
MWLYSVSDESIHPKKKLHKPKKYRKKLKVNIIKADLKSMGISNFKTMG